MHVPVPRARRPPPARSINSAVPGTQNAPSSACRILRFFSYNSFSLPSKLLRNRNSRLSRALRRSMAQRRA